jgi:hypothetical protein
MILPSVFSLFFVFKVEPTEDQSQPTQLLPKLLSQMGFQNGQDFEEEKPSSYDF